MKKLIALLSLIPTMVFGQMNFSLSTQAYFSYYRITEPWCTDFGNGSQYAEHIVTIQQNWSYGLPNPMNPPVHIFDYDEWYFYDSSNSRHLLRLDYVKDDWTYPTYVQVDAQAVHTHWDSFGHYTVDNDHSQKVSPLMRQANITGTYLSQGCSFGGTTLGVVNGRQYFILPDGGEDVLFNVVLHLATSVDSATGLHYAPHFYRINTTSGNGIVGVVSSAFSDSTGNVQIACYGRDLYDVTVTYVTPRSQYDYLYTISFVSAVPK